MEQRWFIPGRPGPPPGPLARYRPIQATRAVESYVRHFTRPGELVLDLFCQGGAALREVSMAGRRVLGFSVNPLLVLITRLELQCTDVHALNRAFTRLADSPKGDTLLRHHLNALYRSACPHCGTPGVARWFAWEREGTHPFRKMVDCPRCQEAREGPTDDDDRAAACRIPSRGLAYYYALDRTVPLNHPARERAAELVALYTPRNLSALMDLVTRLESIDTDERTRMALTGLLLGGLDSGSSLDPYGEGRPRPRTLRLPSRYLERNVWLCLEEELSGLQRGDDASASTGVAEASDVAALIRGEVGGYAVIECAARGVPKLVPPGSAALILADPPRPDGVFWALSALWTGWLWGSQAARPMWPFLARRRFDWEWHCRALRVSLEAVAPLLTPEGHLLILFSDPSPALLESVSLAACGAGYELEGWGYSPQVGYRSVWRRRPRRAQSEPQPVNTEALKQKLLVQTEEAVLRSLRERGEPTGSMQLYGSVYAALAASGLAASATSLPEEQHNNVFALVAEAVRCGFERAQLLQLVGRDEEVLWWLPDEKRAALPLGDRVELLVWELLARQPVWQPDELVNAVYARFHGPLTPELALIMLCVDSYSLRDGELLRLRPEDVPHRRTAELKEIRRDLMKLGRHLGFVVKPGAKWEVRWLDRDELYLFTISSTASLGRYMLAGRKKDAVLQRYLVIPGGRARLVKFRLQRDPRLAQAVASGGWQFLKFRHLRLLLAERELDRNAFKNMLGLDPPVEQEAVQIPLF
jgi:hypothetical protein